MKQQVEYPELTEWLTEQGHTPEEIETILVWVRRHEKQMQVDSIMDSIAHGGLSLGDLVKEALGQSG